MWKRLINHHLIKKDFDYRSIISLNLRWWPLKLWPTPTRRIRTQGRIMPLESTFFSLVNPRLSLLIPHDIVSVLVSCSLNLLVILVLVLRRRTLGPTEVFIMALAATDIMFSLSLHPMLIMTSFGANSRNIFTTAGQGKIACNKNVLTFLAFQNILGNSQNFLPLLNKRNAVAVFGSERSLRSANVYPNYAPKTQEPPKHSPSPPSNPQAPPKHPPSIPQAPAS